MSIIGLNLPPSVTELENKAKEPKLPVRSVDPPESRYELHAWTRAIEDGNPCLSCLAKLGDPCRTPSGKVSELPHMVRRMAYMQAKSSHV